MASDQLILVLLAAFWAGNNAVWSGMTLLNNIRDRIITGVVNNTSVSIAHRQRLLFFDWIPIRFALAGVSLMLVVIILMLPQLADSQLMKPSFPLVCYVTATIPLLGTLYFLVGGLLEFRFLSQTLKADERQTKLNNV